METTTLTRGTYEWPEISAEENYTFSCEYGGIQNSVALRTCNPYGIWLEPVVDACFTFVTANLDDLRNVSI